jgi:hypothetical protein
LIGPRAGRKIAARKCLHYPGPGRVVFMRKSRTSMTMMRALIGAVLAVTLSLATLGAVATPASAAANLSYFLTAGTVGITSGGHTWSLNVSLIGGSSGGPVTIDVLIETPHLSGTEIHDWGMRMPSADFTVNRTTGAATINSHSDLSPVASLNLSYKPTSHTAGTCSAGSETDYLGSLTGSVTLTTGLKGLKLSDAKATFSTPNSLQVDSACVPPLACSFATWGGGLGGAPTAPIAAGIAAGTPGKLAHFANVTRKVSLSAPTGATRTDGASVNATAPVFNSTAKSLTVKGLASGAVTGAGVISNAKTVVSGSETCTLEGTTYTQKSTSYIGASWSSSTQFEAKTILTGTLKVAATGSGEFVNITLTK